MIDLLPDALADALGAVVADVRRECRREIELANAESRATSAELKAQVAALQAHVKVSLDAEIARLAEAVAVIRNGDPGKDADPQVVAEIAAKLVSDELTEIIKADVDAIRGDVEAIGAGVDEKIADQVAAAVAGLPAPKDGEPGIPGIDGRDGEPGAAGRDGEPGEPGHSADPDEVRAIVVAEVEDALKARPVPADGHTPTGEEMAPIIQDAVKAAVDALPRPKDGNDGVDGKDGNDGLVGQDGIPGIDGKDGIAGRDGVGVASISREGPRLEIELDDGRVFDAGEIVGAKGDRGEAGVGVAGALIDRAGSLIVTQSDGSVLTLGPVVGRDGIDGKAGDVTANDYVPDDVAATVSRAISMLAESPPVTVPHAPSIAPSPARKRITTHRDEQGNLIADVVEF